MRKRYLLLLLISIVLTLAVPALFGGVEALARIRQLPWWIAVILLMLLLLSWAFNTGRVRMLLRDTGHPVGFLEGAVITISTEFAGTATPASSGMPATYIFLLNQKGINVGRSMGLVTIIMFFDILFFILTMVVAALAMMVVRSPLATPHMMGVAALIVLSGTVGLWLLSRYFRPIYHSISRVMARFEWLRKRRYKMARGTVDFLRAMRTLREKSWKWRLRILLYSIGYWLPRYLVLIVAVLTVTRDLPVAFLFLIQGILNLGGQMFILPAGGGGVDAAYMALMGPYLAYGEIAFTLIVWRAYTFYWYLIVGGPIFLMKTGKAARDLLSSSGSPRKEA